MKTKCSSKSIFNQTLFKYKKNKSLSSNLSSISRHPISRNSLPTSLPIRSLRIEENPSNTILPLGFTKDFRSWINYMFIKKSQAKILVWYLLTRHKMTSFNFFPSTFSYQKWCIMCLPFFFILSFRNPHFGFFLSLCETDNDKYGVIWRRCEVTREEH